NRAGRQGPVFGCGKPKPKRYWAECLPHLAACAATDCYSPPKRRGCLGGGGGAPVMGRGLRPVPSMDLLYAGTSFTMAVLYSPFTFSSVFSRSRTRPMAVSVAPQSPEP